MIPKNETVDVPENIFADLKKISTATLHTLLFNRGLRDQFMVNVRPFNPEAASFAGEAVTCRYIPAREDIDTQASVREPDNLQWAAIEATGPGQVLVFDSREDIRAASSGHMLMTRLMRRGAVAAVTDGSFRDGPSIAKMPFPVYGRAMNATTRLTYFHTADLQVPIGCAGVAVYPGDIIVGDAEGVIVIPRYLAAEIAAQGLEKEELERYQFSRLDAGEPLEGVYPANEKTLAEFQEWRAKQK